MIQIKECRTQDSHILGNIIPKNCIYGWYINDNWNEKYKVYFYIQFENLRKILTNPAARVKLRLIYSEVVKESIYKNKPFEDYIKSTYPKIIIKRVLEYVRTYSIDVSADSELHEKEVERLEKQQHRTENMMMSGAGGKKSKHHQVIC